MAYIQKHEIGRSILKEIDTLLSGSNDPSQKHEHHSPEDGEESGSQSGVYRRNSVSINNLGLASKKPLSQSRSPKKISKNHQ